MKEIDAAIEALESCRIIRVCEDKDVPDKEVTPRIITEALAGLRSLKEQEPVAWIVWNGWRKESVFLTFEGAEDFRAASQRHDDLSGNLAAYRVEALYPHPAPNIKKE